MDIFNVRLELQSGKSIYDLPLRVTYYARVSTDKDEQAHSLKNQIEYYSNFIKSNPNWTFCEGYIDEGISGTSASKRDSFMKMIEDAKMNKFDYIITKEISRFSRNTLDSIKYTQDLFKYGVGVLFQSDNINTLMPDSELRLTIMASIAQDEVRKISERVRFGFKRALEKGVVLGNNRIWGYTKNDGKLVIDEKQAEIVRIIFDLYANKNMGMRSICIYLTEKGYVNTLGNPFTFSTIRNIISNPKYKGYYCGNKTSKIDYRSNNRKKFDKDDWVLYEDNDAVPPIISEELWEKANRILLKRSEKMASTDKTSYTNKYPYSGKIICMEHNTRFQRALYKYPSGNKEVWQCKNYAINGKAGCSLPVIYSSELDQIIKEGYEHLIVNKADIIHDLVKVYSSLTQKSSIKEDISKCKVNINEIISRKDKLLDLSLKGRIDDDEFESRNRKFNDEVASLKIKIIELEKQEKLNDDIQNSIETLRQIIAKELDFKDGFNNAIIDSFLDRIEVYKTDNNKEIDLKVFFKVLNESFDYTIKRDKNNTSVCCKQHMLNVTNRSVKFPRKQGRHMDQIPKHLTFNVEFLLAV